MTDEYFRVSDVYADVFNEMYTFRERQRQNDLYVYVNKYADDPMIDSRYSHCELDEGDDPVESGGSDATTEGLSIEEYGTVVPTVIDDDDDDYEYDNY